MKEYKVNKHVTKKEFIENGFSYSGFNILQNKKYLYKNLILLTITVDFTEDNIEIYTDIAYSNGNTYPLYNEYGVDKVRKIVIKNYVKEMNKLIKLNLIREVKVNEKNSKI